MRFPRTADEHGPLLVGLAVLFLSRVVGQLLVAALDVGFLPPMESWQSGLLPYPVLLLSQLVILALQAKVCADVLRGRGALSVRRPELGAKLRVFGLVYLGAMGIRYVLRMVLVPEARWVGGCIPIFFHWVLAAFVLVWAHYHRAGTER